MTASSWYLGSWDSVYFDILYTKSRLQRFKLIIEPDLSDASLHVINVSEIISDDFTTSLEWDICNGYRVCEDALVYFWNIFPDYYTRNKLYIGKVYTRLISAPFTNVVGHCDERVDSLCPASGRFVYAKGDVIFVVDLF
jgi:hypothetical protein